MGSKGALILSSSRIGGLVAKCCVLGSMYSKGGMITTVRCVNIFGLDAITQFALAWTDFKRQQGAGVVGAQW